MVFKRVRYFSGQLLSAHDFEADQNYFREKHKLQNRLLFGPGIISGLEVSVIEADQASPQLTISPGSAIDPLGNIILVVNPCTLPLKVGSDWFIGLRYAEHPCDPVPVSSGRNECSRIQESYELHLLPYDPTDTTDCNAASLIVDQLIIGRVLQLAGTWQLDPTYTPLRFGAGQRT
jgi:hypothetical protein